ncbi:hypothetical protein ALC62_00904, partial [Cyphomyrmex costatus]
PHDFALAVIPACSELLFLQLCEYRANAAPPPRHEEWQRKEEWKRFDKRMAEHAAYEERKGPFCRPKTSAADCLLRSKDTERGDSSVGTTYKPAPILALWRIAIQMVLNERSSEVLKESRKLRRPIDKEEKVFFVCFNRRKKTFYN